MAACEDGPLDPGIARMRHVASCMLLSKTEACYCSGVFYWISTFSKKCLYTIYYLWGTRTSEISVSCQSCYVQHITVWLTNIRLFVLRPTFDSAPTIAVPWRHSSDCTARTVLPTTVLQMNNEANNLILVSAHRNSCLSVHANRIENVQKKMRACA